jgi:hypothetical protein
VGTTERPRNEHGFTTDPPRTYASAVTLDAVCRNITTLRGLEPEATSEEIEAAARQYVRKVSGVQATSAQTEEAFELAIRRVAEATAASPPARRQATRRGGIPLTATA